MVNSNGWTKAIIRGRNSLVLVAVVTLLSFSAENSYADGTTTNSNGYMFNLSGIGEDFGQAAAEKGIYFLGTNLLVNQSAVSGGNKRGTYYYNVSYLGLEFDLDKLIGLKGGQIRFITDYQAGQTGSTQVDSSGTDIFTPSALGDEFRLAELTYAQSLFNNKFSFQLGRQSPEYVLGGAFDFAPWHCWYFSYSCGNPGGFALDGSKPVYPSSTWGIDFQINFTQKVYFKSGAYANQLDELQPNHDGWPGQDWGFNEIDGAYFPFQLGYTTTAHDSRYPSSYYVGGFVDTASVPDAFLNSRGLPLVSHPGAPEFHTSSTGVWFNVEKTVYRFDSTSDRGLDIFAAGNFGASPFLEIKNQTDIGASLTGLFPSRARDTINLFASYVTIGSREIEDGDAILAKEHVSGKLPSSENAFEVNYGAAIAPGATLQPYFQYLINPDQLNLTARSVNIRNAVSVGVMLELNYNALFGLPRLSPELTN